MELQTENSNLKLMKSALSRKIKEQTDEIDDLRTKLAAKSPGEVPEGIDLTELKFDS